MKKTWWKEAVAYQIYPRSFMDTNGDGIGDIQGIISKLDYLKELGVDLLWICPMFDSPNDDNGYDIRNYNEILAEFGTMADFDQLLQEAHRRDMRLILDLVINHTSDEHPWFIESRASKASSKRDWYIWRDGRGGDSANITNQHEAHLTAESDYRVDIEAATELAVRPDDSQTIESQVTEVTQVTPTAPPNNWESIFGGSAWEYDKVTDQYYLHLFSRKQPDLNWENQEVRKALYEMINWWLDKGIDGFRVDAISHIKKEPGLHDMPNPNGEQYVEAFPKMMNVDGIHTHLEELKQQTFAKYDIVTVGEANGVSIDNPNDIEQWVGETQGKFNMVFQFEHMALWDAETKKDLDIIRLKEVLTRWQKGLEGKGWNALFLENHDKPRMVSTWGNDKQYWRESATVFAAMYFLMQGTPFIYQGQEIGMTNVHYSTIEDYNDVATRNLYHNKRQAGAPHEEIMAIVWDSSRDNSRTPMQWSQAENAGFTAGKPWLKINPNYVDINVERQLAEESSILNFYKKMIALKKSMPVFTYGSYELIQRDHPQIYAYTRTLTGSENDKDEKIIIIANLSAEIAYFQAEQGMLLQHEKMLLHNYEVAQHEPLAQLELKPYETRTYTL
ncbi:glycoside hydrolase family 13 protein [Bacillus marasmi]|uniref:glycoside hydrolase family 13 protein n=1 Tax=Bacillus marasmi TaxID=1926279 RepID=UPI0011C96FC9|nr:alpha-glucosidase [Bacillus marasmi]